MEQVRFSTDVFMEGQLLVMTTTLSATELRTQAKDSLDSFRGRIVRIFGPGGELIATGQFEGIALALSGGYLYASLPVGHIPLYHFSGRDPGPTWDATHTVEVD